MRRMSAVLVTFAVAAALAAPTLALAQLERRSPGSSPGYSGGGGGQPGVVENDNRDDRGGRDDRLGRDDRGGRREGGGRDDRLGRDDRGGRGGRDDSPQAAQPAPRFQGGPQPAPPPPSSGVTVPRERPGVAAPSDPKFKGGPEPLPPGQRAPSPDPSPYYGGPRPGPPPSPWTTPGGLRRRPMPPDTPRQPPDIRPGWPLRRPLNPVIVRRHYERDRYRIYPRFFLPPILFGTIYYDDYAYRTRYDRGRLSWFDSEWLYRDEGWVEFVFDVDAWGYMLWLEVRDGRVRVDWAEIVFSNGESQVIDFGDRTLSPGLYALYDYRGERRVDHVRMVARAATRDVELILRMER